MAEAVKNPYSDLDSLQWLSFDFQEVSYLPDKVEFTVALLEPIIPQ
jgi:hypothetical protein